MLQNKKLLEHVKLFGEFFKVNGHACFAGNTRYESRLLRAFGTPAVAASIRNPGYRPTCSYRLARPIDMNSLMQAWLIHVCCPGLSEENADVGPRRTGDILDVVRVDTFQMNQKNNLKKVEIFLLTKKNTGDIMSKLSLRDTSKRGTEP